MNDLNRAYSLDFEKPVVELENQIEELKSAINFGEKKIDITQELEALEKKVNELINEIYGNLTSWERVQLSRHPKRPYFLDYVKRVVDDFHEIFGDRKFADDQAMVCGFGKISGHRVAVIGIEKGRKTKDKVKHNFGMSRPEGYRKALRVMKLASKFKIPIVTLIDTPGAYPGIGAEERGQSHAIAENLVEMFGINSPIISVVIGEGGSGGALGIGIADKIFMTEYSIYSVISPESCASILWSDSKKAKEAANALKLNPQKALELGIVDGIIPEPPGGAHRDYTKASNFIKSEIVKNLILLKNEDIEVLKKKRFDKFRSMGNQTIEEF